MVNINLIACFKNIDASILRHLARGLFTDISTERPIWVSADPPTSAILFLRLFAMAEMDDGDEPVLVHTHSGSSGSKSGGDKMFSLKKWNAVAMWSWDVECDTCAICRVQVMGKCFSS